MNIAEDLQEIFEKMPEAFRPEQAQNVNAVIQLELAGEDGGQWAIQIANGAISIQPGSVEAPTLILKMAASDYVVLSRGEANPMNMFMAGKIKLLGDMGLALKFQEMFDIS
jgi:putative sterol carrier protein